MVRVRPRFLDLFLFGDGAREVSGYVIGLDPVRVEVLTPNGMQLQTLFWPREDCQRGEPPVVQVAFADELTPSCRERLRMSGCCLTRTDSATTERAPPGPASRATVASRCRNRRPDRAAQS